MFNNKRIKSLEDRNTELLERVRELGAEVANLKAACTMRVGKDKRMSCAHYWHPYSYEAADTRPIATAMELIQQLMDRQKLTVEVVPASPATFTVTKI